MVERLVFKNHISPAIPSAKLIDQCGFKQTGSTTAVFVDITNTISIMLESNKYVRCQLIDFSKAFYSVDHLIIINKLKACNIADNIIRWVASFLTDRNQLSKYEKSGRLREQLIDLLCRALELGRHSLLFALLICSRLVQLTIFVNMPMIRVYLYRKCVI